MLNLDKTASWLRERNHRFTALPYLSEVVRDSTIPRAVSGGVCGLRNTARDIPAAAGICPSYDNRLWVWGPSGGLNGTLGAPGFYIPDLGLTLVRMGIIR